MIGNSMFIDRKDSDESYHLGLIGRIRKNKNKFILGNDLHIGEENFAYPQFYHWLISLMSHEFVKNKSTSINYFIQSVNIFLFLLFCTVYLSNIHTAYSTFLYLVLTGFFLFMVPFNFLSWNAKNTGLGPRQFSIFLTYLFLYFVYFNYIDSNFLYIILSTAVVFLILITSQFCFQFILFGSPLIAIFLKQWYIGLYPIIAGILFSIIFPSISKKYFRGQFWHKYLYARFLADIYILKSRFSIWRDFIYDFWRITISTKKIPLQYISTNPIIEVLYSLPLFLICTIYFVKNSVLFDKNHSFIFCILATSLILFIATSFRKTRFLGEPQRYIELSLPFCSIFFVSTFYDNTEIILALVFIYLILFFTILKNRNNSIPNCDKTDINEILRTMENNSSKEIRLLCNNFNQAKYFMESQIKVFRPVYTSRDVLGIPFEKYHFKNHITLNSTFALRIYQGFELNCFIHDKNLEGDYNELIENQNLNLKLVSTINNFDIYTSETTYYEKE